MATEVFSDKTLAMIPVFGGVVAVTYDVGYFWGVDPAYFSFFSLAEHIVFAAQAIPFAIVLTVLILGLASWLFGYVRRSSPDSEVVASHIAKGRVGRGFFWFFAISTPLNLIFGNYEATIFLILVLVSGWAVTRIQSNSFVVFQLFGLMHVLCVSFLLGTVVAKAQMATLQPVHTIILKPDTTVHGRVLRAGEKGLLIFDQSASHVRFVRSDEVVSVERVSVSSYPSIVCTLLSLTSNRCKIW